MPPHLGVECVWDDFCILRFWAWGPEGPQTLKLMPRVRSVTLVPFVTKAQTRRGHIMALLKSMRSESETMLKESEGRTATALRTLTSNITTEISAVNVSLATHTASIVTIESRLMALETENAS